jgi:hypothetical protein
MWEVLLDSVWFNVAYPILLLLSIGGGLFFARRYRRTKKWHSSGIENSVIGIFGLIISFTFLTAGNAHRERYAYIHQEVNATEQLYRYSQQMPDSFQRATKVFLVNFLTNQTLYTTLKPDSAANVVPQAVALMDNYWDCFTAFKRSSMDPSIEKNAEKIAAGFDSMKFSFSRNAFSYYERTPAIVMYLLVISSLMIGFLIGFMNGIHEDVHYLLPVIYLVMVAIIMLVIRDLNNPFSGYIRPSFKNLEILNNYIKAH